MLQARFRLDIITVKFTVGFRFEFHVILMVFPEDLIFITCYSYGFHISTYVSRITILV